VGKVSRVVISSQPGQPTAHDRETGGRRRLRHHRKGVIYTSQENSRNDEACSKQLTAAHVILLILQISGLVHRSPGKGRHAEQLAQDIRRNGDGICDPPNLGQVRRLAARSL